MSLFKTAIIVLNYNNSVDTIACVNSILTQSFTANNCCLIIVDNASTDNSYDSILSHLNQLPYKLKCFSNLSLNEQTEISQVNLIQSNNNGGYASGNNLGIKLALTNLNVQTFWILNNDTELHHNCISEVANYCNLHKDEKLILGTLLVRYYKRENIQLLGGKYFAFLGKGKAVYPEFPLKNLTEKTVTDAEKKMDYIVGASIIFSRIFLEEVGLFNDKYFLYLEEIDIIKRSKPFNYKLKIISNAIVYHKEGGATNTNYNKKRERSLYIEYHNCRSKLVFTKTYFPYFYPLTAFFIMSNLILFYRLNPKKIIPIVKMLIKNK